MKKLILGMMLAVFTFIAVLPTNSKAAETTTGITLSDNGENGVDVQLTLPDAPREKISTMKVTLLVEPVNLAGESVTFTFSEALRAHAKVTEYRYHEDSNLLHLYVAGSDPLFTQDKETLDLGTVNAGSNYKVSVIEDSVNIVTGSEEEIVSLTAKPFISIEDESKQPQRPDDTSLKKLMEEIKRAEGFAKNQYTAESYQRLLAALEKAKAAANDPKASEEQLKQAIQDLQNAISSLVKVKDENSAEEKHEQDVTDQKVPDKTDDETLSPSKDTEEDDALSSSENTGENDTLSSSENSGEDGALSSSGNTGDVTNLQPYVGFIVISGCCMIAYGYYKWKMKTSREHK